MAKVNNTINKEENIMANNYSKMLKADLIKLVEKLQTENNTQQVLIDRLQEKNTAQALRLKEAERHYRSMEKTTRHLRFLYNQVQAKKSYKTNSHMDKLSEDTDRYVTESHPESDPKPAYANAEQWDQDKEDQDNISKHHDKYPTAKQVDLICNICANQKIFGKMPNPEHLTKATAGKMLDHLFRMKKEYKGSNSAEATVLKKQHNISWEEACKMREQIAGQVMYDRLTAKYGKLPTLTYAYKVK